MFDSTKGINLTPRGETATEIRIGDIVRVRWIARFITGEVLEFDQDEFTRWVNVEGRWLRLPTRLELVQRASEMTH